MDLIDKYIYAIGKKLPYDSRDEIKLELKSLLLDEIESSYGNNPSLEDIEKVIYEFGSPADVASRYKKDDVVISRDYTGIYFILIKILVAAMIIAFSVIFIVDLITNFESFNVLKSVFNLFGNVITSSLSAIGALTCVMILVTKYNDEKFINFEENWSIKELDMIKIKPENESKIVISFELFFSVLFLLIINVAPTLISLAEKAFEFSGMELGHYINIVVFKELLILITLVWLLEIFSFIIRLINGESKYISLYDLIVEVLNIVLLIYIIQNSNLYLNYTSLLGFRGIFVIMVVISIVEIISNIYKFIKYYILEVKL